MSFTNYAFSEVMNQKGQIQGKYMAQMTANAASVTLTNAAISQAAAEQITGNLSGCHAADYLNLEFVVDINQAQNIRVLCYGISEADGTTLYLCPWSATQDYFECLTDADGGYFAKWEVNKAFDAYVFYAWMGTDGGTNPAITSSYLSISAR